MSRVDPYFSDAEGFEMYDKTIYKTSELWQLDRQDASYCENQHNALLFMIATSLDRIATELRSLNAAREEAEEKQEAKEREKGNG